MKKISAKLLLVVILSVSLLGILIAGYLNQIKLKQGKNNVSFSSSLGYVKDFVKNNPEIDSISYNEGNKTIGFVNVFGGIGKNFILTKNKTYEITAKANITIYIK